LNILIVDDEKNIRESISKLLKIEGFTTFTSDNAISGLRILESTNIDLIILDLRMPGMSGLELLQIARDRYPNIIIIMISAYGEITDAVNAMKVGAYDYIVKPFDPELLIDKLRTIQTEHNISSKVRGTQNDPHKINFIGNSIQSNNIREKLRKIGATGSNILISGESGVGKEVAARYIHEYSDRSVYPFVAINVGGMPDTLIESELFGFEKGAFTGAANQKQGLLESAGKGTIFLDEISELPINLQVKLLRVIQERKIQRLGAITSIDLNARIIAASNKDLRGLVSEGKFREDLFYRLFVVPVILPPLRERKEDIPDLIAFFISRFNIQFNKNIKGISAETLNILIDYNYPGNIRELQNIIERAFVFCESDTIGTADIDITITKSKQNRYSHEGKNIKEIEKDAILNALSRWEGNRTKAAIELGISRRTLISKIKEYTI